MASKGVFGNEGRNVGWWGAGDQGVPGGGEGLKQGRSGGVYLSSRGSKRERTTKPIRHEYQSRQYFFSIFFITIDTCRCILAQAKEDGGSALN